jgi:hypothetical protein
MIVVAAGRTNMIGRSENTKGSDSERTVHYSSTTMTKKEAKKTAMDSNEEDHETALHRDDMEGNHKDEEDHKTPLRGECMCMLFSSVLVYRLHTIRKLTCRETVPLGDEQDSIKRTLELPLSF